MICQSRHQYAPEDRHRLPEMRSQHEREELRAITHFRDGNGEHGDKERFHRRSFRAERDGPRLTRPAQRRMDQTVGLAMPSNAPCATTMIVKCVDARPGRAGRLLPNRLTRLYLRRASIRKS
jgi:hypothetical protein